MCPQVGINSHPASTRILRCLFVAPPVSGYNRPLPVWEVYVIGGSRGMIRILIVDDNLTTVENVARLLNFEPDIEVVGTARNGQMGVSKAHEMQPDVVLMDINMPDMDGIEACRQIAQSSPKSRVMMMSVQADMAYLKGAMNAGAREFLIKPFDYDELITAVRRVFQADPTPAELAARASPASARGEAPLETKIDRGVMIAVYSPKGGVGCSTIAANLAISLAGSRQAQVVLMDADWYFGDLDAHLDLQPPHRVTDILEKYDPEDLETIKLMFADHPSGIKLLAAPARPELAELIQADVLIPMVEAVRKMSDYLVVDLGSRYNALTQKLLDLADRLVLVVTPELPAIKNAGLLLKLPSCRSYAPEKVIPILNQFIQDWGITPEAAGNTIGRMVALTIPSDRPAALNAINRGLPLLLSAPRSPMIRPILDLEKTIPDRKQLASELAEFARQKAQGPPPPITSPAKSEQEAGRSRITPSERRGCARWLPFLDRSRRG